MSKILRSTPQYVDFKDILEKRHNVLGEIFKQLSALKFIDHTRLSDGLILQAKPGGCRVLLVF